jgi:hypothetical protein
LFITNEQVCAARALLRWEQRGLDQAPGVSLPSVKRLETQRRALAAQDRTMWNCLKLLKRAASSSSRRTAEDAAFVFESHNARTEGNKAALAAEMRELRGHMLEFNGYLCC